jgi:hypothetical protein
MFKFLKNIIEYCFGIKTEQKYRQQNYNHFTNYQPEGNRFIFNKDL